MKIGDIAPAQLAARLASEQGLPVRIGPFVVRVYTSISQVSEGIDLLYQHHTLAEEGGFTDFHVRVRTPNSLRRWFKPQVLFYFDDIAPFKPLPYSQALPFLEWGLNWVFGMCAHQYLMIHAAVVEKHGRAIILPAPPGSGKSTLCAALVNRGWRLLSDEMALISRHDGQLTALTRPVSLKNASIDIIRRYAPDAVIGPLCHDTSKGTVAHMAPPRESVARAGEPASPARIIFPRYQAGAEAKLEPLGKGAAFLQIADNTFNYSVLAGEGFRVLGDVIDACDCYRFSYSRLDDAIAIFDNLAASRTT